MMSMNNEIKTTDVKTESDEVKKKVEDKVEQKVDEKNSIQSELAANNKALQDQIKSLISELDALKTENEGLKTQIAERNSIIDKYKTIERNSVVNKIRAIDSKFEDTDSFDINGLEVLLNSLERTAAVLTTSKNEIKKEKEIPKTEFIKEQNSVNYKRPTNDDFVLNVFGGF